MKDILRLAIQILIIGAVLLGLGSGGIAIYKYHFLSEVEDEFKGFIVTPPIILTSSSTLVTLTASSTLYASGSEYGGLDEATPMILGTSSVRSMQDPITKSIHIGNDVDEFCQYIYFQASTTDAVLEWTYSFSNDGINWYMQDDNQLVSSGVVTHGTGTTTHKWTPGVTDALGREDCVDANANYIQIEYSRSANLSGGKIFTQGWTRTDY